MEKNTLSILGKANMAVSFSHISFFKANLRKGFRLETVLTCLAMAITLTAETDIKML